MSHQRWLSAFPDLAITKEALTRQIRCLRKSGKYTAEGASASTVSPASRSSGSGSDSDLLRNVLKRKIINRFTSNLRDVGDFEHRKLANCLLSSSAAATNGRYIE